MWIREIQPEVWARTAMFGHTNTYMVKRLTGEWAIDPSTVSITGLYNTARHDLTWNQRGAGGGRTSPSAASAPDASPTRSPGRITPEVARELGSPADCVVLTGGNDAVLAALSGGVTESGADQPGDGTVEITSVCVDHPVASPSSTSAATSCPDRWLTFFVLNAGGKALEWFKSVFCSEMSDREFYGEYVPGVLRRFLDLERRRRSRAALSRCTAPSWGDRGTASSRRPGTFSGLDLETTRDEMLLAMVRGQRPSTRAPTSRRWAGWCDLGSRVIITGTGGKVARSSPGPQAWFGDYEFVYQEQSRCWARPCWADST